MTSPAREGHAAAPALRMLDDVVGERRIKHRDCRSCRNFRPAEDGLQYGWCIAHKQHVKLYHPADSWYSQCLFKSIRRAKAGEPVLGADEQRSGVSVGSVASSDSA
jgi:hypothetical protein